MERIMLFLSFFVLLVLNDLPIGEARVKRTRGPRGLKGSSLQRTRLVESDNEDQSSTENNRFLKEIKPCTYYYPSRKSKFNKYDDDWYNPCKTIESTYPTTSPSDGPSLSAMPAVDNSSHQEKNETTPILTEQSVPLSQKPIVDLDPNKAPVEAPAVSQETIIDVTKKEKRPSCLQAKAGRVVPTSINFTIHYEYELLAKRESNMTDVVWPEVDSAFQRFLALTLIDCDVNVENHGASSTYKSRLSSISPEPIDSVGSSYPTGWNESSIVSSNVTSCTNIGIKSDRLAKRGLYCDVVTGSITLYLSEVSYMDAFSNPAVVFQEYRKEVFKVLREEINEGGESISNYLDSGLGIRGFYFIGESASLDPRPISTIPDAASEKLNSSGLNKETTATTPTLIASLTALIAFTMAAGVFAIRQKNIYASQYNTFKKNTTPRMDDIEIEFFDLDMTDGESSNDGTFDMEMLFPPENNDENCSEDSGSTAPRIPISDFDELLSLNEKSNNDSSCFEYSKIGRSMKIRDYREEDFHNIIRETNGHQPSSEYQNVVSKTRLGGSDVIEIPPVRAQSSTNSLTKRGSPTLEYILSLDSSVLSIPYDENVNEPPTSIASSETKSVASTDMPGTMSSSPLEQGESNSLTICSSESSIESPPSSPIEVKEDYRSECLKNRRNEIENRFQNYRRSLSESINKSSSPHSAIWSASRKFLRSVSLYKNSEQSFLSPASNKKGGSSRDVTLSSRSEGMPRGTGMYAPGVNQNDPSHSENEEQSLENENEKCKVDKFPSSQGPSQCSSITSEDVRECNSILLQ